MSKHLFVGLICVVVLFLAIPTGVYARKSELIDQLDTDRISESIADFATGFVVADGVSLTITKNDIDLSKAFVFYVDTDIFKIDTNNFAEIESELAKGVYMFEVPIYLEQGTYMAYVSKGLPPSDQAKERLSDEEYLALVNDTGKWTVVGGGFYEGIHKDYYQEAKSISGETQTPLLIGGLPYFRDPVALYPDENGNAGALVPLFPSTIQWDLLQMSQQAEPVVFEYAALKDHISKIPANRILPLTILIAGLAALGIFIFMRTKRMKIKE